MLELACRPAILGRTEETMNASVFDAIEGQLRAAQAKLTFLGPQSKPIPTLVLFTEGRAPSMKTFVPFHHAHHPYDNDDLPYTVQFAVSRDEFLRLLRAEKALLTNASASGAELISFTVVIQTTGGIAGDEFVVKESQAEPFYRGAIGALNPENSAARQGLTSQALKMGLKL
jgi:hypothetical protein